MVRPARLCSPSPLELRAQPCVLTGILQGNPGSSAPATAQGAAPRVREPH